MFAFGSSRLKLTLCIHCMQGNVLSLVKVESQQEKFSRFVWFFGKVHLNT